MVEWLRFLREKKPRFAIYENVKNIVGARFKATFDLFVKELEDYGYNVYWQVLNAKNYGIPQNRERVYCVIIRKDLDNGKFNFPSPIPLKHSLSDMLEQNVDEKYYLSDEKVAGMMAAPRGGAWAAPAAPAPHPVATQRERKTPAAAVSRFFRFIGIPPFGSGLLEKV